MLLFKDIYNKAINLFDDPIIMRAYAEDAVRWEKLMYPYLENGVNKFTNPTKIAFLLVDQTLPSGQIETFVGNGTATYQTTAGSFTPTADADFSFYIGTRVDKGATYDNGTVTFSENVPVGTTCAVEWYSGGHFNTDFSQAASRTVSAQVIEYRVKDILANALVLAWAEDEKNFLLDIKNLLTDHDFRIYSPANSIAAKQNWVNSIKFNLDTQTNKLSWDLYSRQFHGGNYYGL